MADARFTMPTGEPVIEVVREFDAPRALVWKVSTEPFHFAQWWGPHGYTNPVCELDVRPGGKWRVEQRDPAGAVFRFHGEFIEVAAPARMVQTFAFADFPPATVTLTLEEIPGGRTRLTSTMRFPSVAARDGMVQSGMQKGAEESYQRLDALLASLQAAEETVSHFGNAAMSATADNAGYASVNGIELYYEVHGSSGRPLVLLHGGFGLGQMFAPLLPQLEASRRIVTVDLQAHGHTADIDRPMTWSAMADDVAALIRDLGLGPVDLLGYSLGGGVALEMAIKHPDLVRRLVLVSIPYKRDGWFADVRAGMANVNAAAAESMKASPMYAAYAAAAPRPEDFGRLADKLGDLLRSPYDLTEGARKLPMPVLLVYGDADGIPPSHAAEFFALLGGGLRDADWDGSGMVESRLAILPAQSHYSIFMAPALLPPVLDFLDATPRTH